MTKKYVVKYLIINRLYLRKSLRISSFKEKFAAFSMKTTDPKDLVKVNQILPIMQEHFGKSTSDAINIASVDVVTLFFHQSSKSTLSVPREYYCGVSYLILQYHLIETPVSLNRC